MPEPGLEYDPQGSADPEFERQRAAFLAIPKAELRRYAGEFVLSKDGAIVDHDPTMGELTRRSVERFGSAPVYFTKVGEDVEVRIDTPFLS